jgi:hypothetical protein
VDYWFGRLLTWRQNQTGAVFANSTIRQTLFLTAQASQIRLKFSNVFGGSNLPITAVTVALPINQTAGIHQIQPSTLQTITFSGKPGISIPNGALAVSDPIAFPIKAQQIVTVTMYLEKGQLGNSVTSHPGSRTTSWFQFGNAVSAPALAVNDTATQSTAHWYFLSSIETWVPPKQKSFLIVGDSITDGRGSTTNANNRWPDLLLRRLQKSGETKHISFGNLAAGGNRILADGLGPNAFGRIDRDVLSHPGVGYAMVFEGVNDSEYMHLIFQLRGSWGFEGEGANECASWHGCLDEAGAGWDLWSVDAGVSADSHAHPRPWYSGVWSDDYAVFGAK